MASKISKTNRPKVWRVVFTETFIATRDIYANSKEEAVDKAKDLMGDMDFNPYLEDDEPEIDIERVYHRPDIHPTECDFNLVDGEGR